MNLNRVLQGVLNPPEKKKQEITINGRILRTGDKVMQTKNNYDLPWTRDGENGSGVFNGDVGILERIEHASSTLYVLFDDRTAMYSFESAAELELAYAITVHKSQGSEFEAVVMPVLNVVPQLSYRNLLYTAVTRAKSKMILVGSRDVVHRMVENDKKTRRFSALRAFLTEEDNDEA